jgi:tRNA pseudouridine55 synthase
MDSGIIFLDKEVGMTSRYVDNAIMKRFNTRKVGHLGTLDPFASGLLIIGINKGTKALSYLDDSKKSYVASLVLGKKSTTLDIDGEISDAGAIPSLTEEDIKTVLSSFLGESEQLPPMTSAIKINGTPLYKLAHQGKEIERKKRKVTIYSINLISYKDDVIVFSTTVSRGTYIRVLGADIAKKLGTDGYLSSLRRSAISTYLLSISHKLDELDENSIVDPTIYINTMKHLEVDEEGRSYAMTGKSMCLDEDYGERILLTYKGSALAVYKLLGKGTYAPERGLF